MCQQWLSVIGLVFDIIGVSLIAIEWYGTYRRDSRERMDELHRDFERHLADVKSEEFVDPRAGEYTMAKEFSKLLYREWRYRGWLFGGGLVLVVFGFLGQLLGSLPPGIPFFPFRPC